MLASADVARARPTTSPILDVSRSPTPTGEPRTLNANDYMLPANNQATTSNEEVAGDNEGWVDDDDSSSTDKPLPENMSVQQFLAQLASQEEAGSESESETNTDKLKSAETKNRGGSGVGDLGRGERGGSKTQQVADERTRQQSDGVKLDCSDDESGLNQQVRTCVTVMTNCREGRLFNIFTTEGS